MFKEKNLKAWKYIQGAKDYKEWLSRFVKESNRNPWYENITEIKNLMDGLSIRLDPAKDRDSELKDRFQKITQNVE